MRKLSMIAAAAVAAVATNASAATFIVGAEGVTPAGQTVIANFDDLNPPFTTTGNGAQVLQTGQDGVGAAVNDTAFLAVLGGGTAGYTFGNGGLESISFDLGTPDTYNFVTLSFIGGGTQTFGEGGTPLGLVADSRVTFNADPGQRINGITLGSSQNSLEVDNISVAAVPEPMTWALFILGFGAIGTQLRRRQRTSVSFA